MEAALKNARECAIVFPAGQYPRTELKKETRFYAEKTAEAKGFVFHFFKIVRFD